MSENTATIEFICRNNSRVKLVAHKKPDQDLNMIGKEVVEQTLGYRCPRDTVEVGSQRRINLPWRLDMSDKARSDNDVFVVEENPINDIVLGRLACTDLYSSRERGSYPMGSPPSLTPAEIAAKEAAAKKQAEEMKETLAKLANGGK